MKKEKTNFCQSFNNPVLRQYVKSQGDWEKREERREENRTEQNRTEQNRTEQNRTEQNRTEQNRTEQMVEE
ncbi:hypothetical protein [Enterovibrio paralichthyis]|uniref:hypothetical protein n=1 Tax=Enterovibrio paralichthyis TaxID=2853805 RepID=UPI001C444EDB|nr:hypothetical protein [Enterovibrio paralichthyis]MBV7298223.1 hypothetical protein [Enterovibrio paralichthyis]